MTPDNRLIDDLAQAVLDGETVDWAAAETASDDGGHLVEQLKVVAAVGEVLRDGGRSEAARPATEHSALDHLESWGHLRISERIGQGAFGAVYRAWDTRLEREVALKLMPTGAGTAPTTASSIIHEGQLLARVRHPNVVTIYGADHIADHVGLWMELVSGRTLEELLRAGTVFEPIEVTRIGRELGRALAAVHAAGLLHRDIKAQNVMRSDDGRIVLMDFGTGRDLADTGSDLTGTPLYLAPEVFHGQGSTAASDIYSLGVLLYYLLTRSFPVHGRTIGDVRLGHEQNRRTALRAVRSDVPVRLARIIERAVDPRPERRYSTADALCADLEAASASPPRRWLRLRYAAAAVAALTVFAWVAGVSDSREQPGSTGRRILQGTIAAVTGPTQWFRSSKDEASVSTPVSLGVDEQLLEGPLLSPDGAYIAYSTMPGGEMRLYVKALSSDKPILIASSSQFGFQPFFSPDSSSIGFFDGGRMWRASVRGGARTMIVDRVIQPRGASWGDDGVILYAPQFRSGLWRVSANGGQPRQVTTPDAALGETGHGYPSLLPGSRVVIFRAQGRSWQEGTLVAYSFDTARRVSIVRAEGSEGRGVTAYSVETAQRRELAEDGRSARYTTAGELVYLEGSTLIARQFDPSRLDFTSPRTTVMADVSTFSLSDAGSLLYRSTPPSTPNSWLVWVNRDGTFEKAPGLPPEISHVRACPANPSRLVFERYEHIYTYDAASGTSNRITSVYSNKGPVWTHTCDRIFFSATRTDRALDVTSISADGGNERVIAEVGGQHHLDIALNGTWLAYETTKAGPKGPSRDIWLRGLNEDAIPRPLSKGVESKTEPALSPDGRWVAYASSDANAQFQVYVQAVDGPEKRPVSLGGGREPAWNPNGGEIFYRQGDKLVAVGVVTRAGHIAIGKTTVLFEGPYKPAGVSSRSYDVSPDGNRFLMVRREPARPRSKPVIRLVTNWLEELKRRVATRTSE